MAGTDPRIVSGNGHDRGEVVGEAMNLLWPYCQGPKDCISESRFVFCAMR
jgi:hypothetical protein